jgi:hypothetical protein
MHRPKVRELGALRQSVRWRSVDGHDPAVVEDDLIAATQPGQANGGVPTGREITVRRDTERAAAFRGRIEPTGDGRQGESSMIKVSLQLSVVSRQRAGKARTPPGI